MSASRNERRRRCAARLRGVLLLALASSCGGRGAQPGVTVLAASSLRDLFGSQRAACEAALGEDVVFSFGASSSLARRIEAGERFDVFLSADEASLERALPRLDPTSRRAVLENRLALIAGEGAPADGIRSPRDLLGHPGELAIGAPAVPAGRYARDWLRAAGLLETLAPRFRSAANARAALTLVESGAAPFGFVYATDAALAEHARTLWTSARDEPPRIRFFAARARAAGRGAERFLAWLGDLAFRAEAQRAGFDLPEPSEERAGRGVGATREPATPTADILATVLLSLRVGLVSTLLILVPGVGLGYLLARRAFRGKTLVRVLVTLPMLLPPVAVGLLLLVLLSHRYALGAALASALGGTPLFTWWAAVLAAAVMSFPLLVLGAESGFRGVPRRLEQVAATLGATPWRVFLTVSLPLARKGILHGAAFAFVRGLGEYGATALVAGDVPGRTRTLSLAIFDRIESFEDGQALLLAGISFALALATVVAAELCFAGEER